MATDIDQPTLATVDDFQKRFRELARDADPELIQDALEDATQHLEDRTGRRLAPFTNHVYQDRLFGIDPDEMGADVGMPMDIFGSLGMSMANAFGQSSLVRHMWLDQFAPMRPELWTYSVQSIQIYRTYGDSQPIDFANGGLLGPDATDGHCWFRIGTFIPEGSRVQVIYSGGYTVDIPPSLRRACLLQAAKFLILEAEPQNRRDMNMDEIDTQIAMLIGPWVRG